MFVTKLHIKDFRNINDLSIDLSPNINLFYGDNAQGKTNIVEALNYLSLLKSFRDCDNISLIQNNKPFSVIECDYKENKITHNLKCVIHPNTTKCFFDGKEVKKKADFVGSINTIAFSPENVFLFKNSPLQRREFLDDEISKLSPSYYVNLLRYNKLKKEKNDLLKKENIDTNLLDVLDSQLSKLNLNITEKRKNFVDNINKYINEIYNQITESNSIVRLIYQSENLDKNVDEIYQSIKDYYDEDVKYKATQYGIHRDDLILELNKQDISLYGSQGQNRLATLALKLSGIKVIEELSFNKAIVILDDVFSELDASKQKQILKRLQIENQVLITSASDINIDDFSIQKYLVSLGKIGG